MSESPTHCPRLLMSIRLFYHFLQFTFRGWSFIIYFFIYPLFDILYFFILFFFLFMYPSNMWMVIHMQDEYWDLQLLLHRTELNWTRSIYLHFSEFQIMSAMWIPTYCMYSTEYRQLMTWHVLPLPNQTTIHIILLFGFNHFSTNFLILFYYIHYLDR